MNRTRLSLPVIVVIVAAALALIVATTGSSAKKAPAVAANSAISVQQTSLGKTLADANGRTLYLFANDKPNVSTLSAAGRAFWPPFTATARPAATDGAGAGDVGLVTGTTGSGGSSYG
jgi:predicted lipoprotein with Yx(FWY)xxD motif